MENRLIRFGATAIAGILMSVPAMAVASDGWLVKGTISGTIPEKSSDSFNTISRSGIFLDEAASAGVSLDRFILPHVAVGLYSAWPYYQDIKGNSRLSQLGLHEFAQVRQLPVGATITYHFLPTAVIRPYVGLDVDYAHFFDEQDRIKGINVAVDDAWGYGGQAGLDIRLNDRWLLTGSARYAQMKTTVRFSGMIDQDVTMKINPWSYAIGLGYRF